MQLGVQSVVLAFLLVILFGILLLLQLVFCKLKFKYVGLVLPAISFFLSILFVCNFESKGNVTWLLKTGVILGFLFVFNIITAIFLAIYWIVKGKDKMKTKINKMIIQDIE